MFKLPLFHKIYVQRVPSSGVDGDRPILGPNHIPVLESLLFSVLSSAVQDVEDLPTLGKAMSFPNRFSSRISSTYQGVMNFGALIGLFVYQENLIEETGEFKYWKITKKTKNEEDFKILRVCTSL